jgi:S-formylglutathione hydrolase FrmB
MNMALIHTDFFSESLMMNVGMDVILPQARSRGGSGNNGSNGDRSGQGFVPALWLLHGEGDNHTSWQRFTSIERYAEAAGIAVVMPAVEMSFYADMENGFKYFRFLSSELPAVCRDFFPISSAREDNVVAGASMGGYGAIKLALTFPKNYRAAVCFSGGNFPAGPAPDSAFIAALHPAIKNVPLISFGLSGDDTIFDLPALMGSPHDLFFLAKAAIASGDPMPRLFHVCGSSDPRLGNARRTRDYFATIPGNPFGYEYREAGGGYDWKLMDAWVEEFIGTVFPSRSI